MTNKQVDDIQKAITKITKLENQLEQARKERAIALRDATKAGLKATELSELTGLPLPTVRADLLRTKDI